MSSPVFDNTRLKCGLCPWCVREGGRKIQNTDVGGENLCILALNMMIIRTLENRMIIRSTK